MATGREPRGSSAEHHLLASADGRSADGSPAGPILPWKTIAAQLAEASTAAELFAERTVRAKTATRNRALGLYRALQASFRGRPKACVARDARSPACSIAAGDARHALAN
jgi:hypothetical protein